MKFLKTYQLFENKDEKKGYVTATLLKALEENDDSLFNKVRTKYSDFIDHYKIGAYIMNNIQKVELLGSDLFPKDFLNNTNVIFSDTEYDSNKPIKNISLMVFLKAIYHKNIKDALLEIKNAMRVSSNDNIDMFLSYYNEQYWKSSLLPQKAVLINKYIKQEDNPNEIEFDLWFNYYKPEINQIERAKPENRGVADNDLTSYNGTMYETYGDDVDYVIDITRKNIQKVWTMFDDSTIAPGYYRVNRLAYFITEKEWTNKDLYIIDEDYEDKDEDEDEDDYYESFNIIKSFKLFESESESISKSEEKQAYINTFIINNIENYNKKNIEDALEKYYENFYFVVHELFYLMDKSVKNNKIDLLDILNNASLENYHSIVELIISSKKFQTEYNIELETLKKIFLNSGIQSPVKLDPDDILNYDIEHRNNPSVHYFSDGHDDYISYDDAYYYFITDIKEGNNSRIYTELDENDDEDCINSYGDTPY